ncbi:unnamed protein product [Lupinus luteus]|uniref:Uncharacterized protein n=1 Tax=Lupinus luteus TaxID=3873 RepID=A0AAV1WC48_LUPLU
MASFELYDQTFSINQSFMSWLIENTHWSVSVSFFPVKDDSRNIYHQGVTPII